MKNYKNLQESLDILDNLCSNNNSGIIHKKNNPIDKTNVLFKKNDPKGFSLEFTASRFNVDENNVMNIKKFDLEVSGVKFNIKQISNVHIKNDISPKLGVSNVSAKLGISNLQTKGFRKTSTYYYRLFIPLKEDINIFKFIHDINYETETYYSRGCIRINYDENLDLDMYIHNKYLIIDSLTKFSFEDFNDYYFSSLVSFAYVTGELPRNEGYFFAYKNKDLKTPKYLYYQTLPVSIYTWFSPIYSRAKTPENIKNEPRVISSSEFSKLCQKAYKEVDFLNILLLIIESSNSSLSIMPAGFCVALEGLTQLINDNKKAETPIKVKKLAKEIREKLLTVIEDYTTHLDVDGKNILVNKIKDINQAPNATKLSKPFELLDFKLTAEDEKIIKHRNDFLHCNPPKNYCSNVNDTSSEIFYISLRLYTLLSVLILKSVGYDDKIANYPKILTHKILHTKKLKEPYFRKL